MRIQNVSSFQVVFTDMRIPAFGTAIAKLQPGQIVTLFDEDAEKSYDLANALTAGLVVKLDNSQPLDGTPVDNSNTEVGALLAGKAGNGANSDITSLSGLTTPLSLDQGGTAVSSPPSAGTILTATSGTTADWLPASSGNFSDNEIPSGVYDGINTHFVLSSAPIDGSLHLYFNGLRLTPGIGNDYTISGVDLIVSIAPKSTSSLLCDYRF